jgi:hypothetical protein
MTERLSNLLHDEADTLLIPTPPADAVLHQGRGLRRRRRLTTGAAVLGVLAVVGTGVALTVDREPSGDADVASTTPSYAIAQAFAVGRTVHLGPQGAPSATMDEDVHSLHYTSAGVLVRTNMNGGASDGSGEEHYTLVRPDGSTKKLEVTTAEQAVSTDPSQPYLAFARVTGETATAVVLDITTGEQFRVELPVPTEPSGWSAPPVSLDGDHVYVGMGSAGVYDVNWRTGRATPTDLSTPFPDVHGGRTIIAQHDKVQVVDVATGDSLRTIAIDSDNWVVLSPDGRWAKAGATVYDVASDAEVKLPAAVGGYGWDADGHLFQLDGAELVICDPASGACERRPLGFTAPDPNAATDTQECDNEGNCVTDVSKRMRLGGISYES